MKKIIIIACVLMFIGAGCAKTTKQANTTTKPQTENQPQAPAEIPAARIIPTVSPEEIAEIRKFLEPKSAEVGFKIYYPTFTPDQMKLNEKNITIEAKEGSPKIVNYRLASNSIKVLDDGTSTSSLIIITFRQQKDESATNPELLRLKGKESPYFNGQISTITRDGVPTHYIELIKDKTLIKMSTKADTMSLDTFSRIAESME